MKYLSWQTQQWQLLWEARQKNRLAHALLLVGACDLEIKQFVEFFSVSLLCHEPDLHGNACMQCHACHLFLAKSHPDFILIEPEQPGQIIKIDQIRNIVYQANQTAMQSGYRVIVIHPAHAMNIAAANALLKTLEEPAAKTLVMLISDQSSRLMATITSRCQRVIFHKPPTDLALAWLKEESTENAELLLTLTEGAPLKARALLANDMMALRQMMYTGLSALSQGQADPIELAAKWQEYDMLLILRLLASWLRDGLRFKLTQGHAKLINSDHQNMIASSMKTINQENLLSYVDTVQQNYGKMLSLHNLNKQLLLEELLIRWTKLYVSC